MKRLFAIMFLTLMTATLAKASPGGDICSGYFQDWMELRKAIHAVLQNEMPPEERRAIIAEGKQKQDELKMMQEQALAELNLPPDYCEAGQPKGGRSSGRTSTTGRRATR